jgi:hypothetical protein
MPHISRRVVFILVVAAVVAACSPSATRSSSTSTAESVTTLETAPPTTIAASTTSSVAAAPSLTPPTYQIIWRNPIEGQGDEIVVLLDVASYNSLTDLDVFDLIADVVERFPPVTVAHIVDDHDAAVVVTNPDASAAEQNEFADNYLARLDEGFRITYLGPFADSGTAVLGS